jgi:lipopolysaccharide exporter
MTRATLEAEPALPAGHAERRLLSGTLWISGAQGLATIATLLGGVLAARLLSKHDIGLMAIAVLVFNVLDQLSQSGFEKALVQRTSEVGSYLNVAWTWGAIRGVLLALALGISAWPLSRFYHEPALAPIIATTAIVPLISGLTNVGTVFFSRQLDFRTIFRIRGAQAVATLAVTIPAIFLLRNVWALVLAQIAGALAAVVVSYIAQPYRPRIEWNREKLVHLVHYGKWLTLTTAVIFIVTQGDDLFVSKWFGPADLAVYQLAYQLANLPTTHVVWVLGQSTFPTYARLQHEPERLRNVFTTVMRGLMYFAGAVSAFVAVLVPYLVRHIVGTKWQPIVPLVHILVLGGFIRSFMALAGPLFQAAGRSDLDFRMNLPRFFVIVLFIWPACAFFGLDGASWLVVASVASILPLWLRGVRIVLGLTWREVLAESAPAIISTALLFVLLLGLRSLMGLGLVAMFAVPIAAVAVWLGGLRLLGLLDPRLDFFSEMRRLLATLRTAKEVAS